MTLSQCHLFGTKYRSNAWNYGIPKNASLSVEHIICLVVYSDFHRVAAKLRASFVPRSDDETLSEMIKRQRPFHWFARNLHVVVELFGCALPSNRSFYHLFDSAVPFRSTVCRWNHIVSMTDAVEVAAAFSENAGILVKMKCFQGRCGTQKCFGLDLVSAFPIERERLFAGYPGDERLRIEDIVHCVNGTRYAAQLRALNVFEKAMNGDVSPTDNALDGLSISKTTKRIVRAIAGGTRHGLDAYFGSILDGFQAAKQNVILDLYSMRRKQAFSFLAPFFLSSSTSSALKFAVKFHVISSLFENVRTVIVTNGSGAAHHAIGLSAAYLTYILSSLRALKDGSFRKLKWIKMRNVTVMKTGNGVDGKDALNRLVQRFEDRFRAQIGFDIYVERVRFCQRDYCTLFIAKMRNKERGHVT